MVFVAGDRGVFILRVITKRINYDTILPVTNGQILKKAMELLG